MVVFFDCLICVASESPVEIEETPYEADQAKLREAVFAVFHNKKVDETMEELFRVIWSKSNIFSALKT